MIAKEGCAHVFAVKVIKQCIHAPACCSQHIAGSLPSLVHRWFAGMAFALTMQRCAVVAVPVAYASVPAAMCAAAAVAGTRGLHLCVGS